MTAVIYNPLEDYETKLKDIHNSNIEKFFQELVERSGVDIEENRRTVKQYNESAENLQKLQKKLRWKKFFRVLMYITIVLIPLVVLKTNPAIKALEKEIAETDKKTEELLALAHEQMRPLNGLFTDRDALRLIESTVPLIAFDDHLTVKQEVDMKLNYDFSEYNADEQSTVDVLAGRYNENPFLFENKLIHTMGTETYHGYKTIHWTERYRDSDGKMQTRSCSETLHATVTKPKPFYNTQVVLNYCAQGGPDLSFSRDATHLEQKSERQIERIVKRGEKELKRKSNKALRENDDFVSMSNTDFEVLFDALDRTDEVQFRTLFTPLAQTNMVDLLLSKVGYGDDFNFTKTKRTNRIVSNHSQGRRINLLPSDYTSYSFDVIQENFVGKNNDFFKMVYFDFAPLLAIPLYQERPVHSLKPIPEQAQLYALKECEALANAVDRSHMVHPDTKTPAILKSTFVRADDQTDEACITAYSYDIAQRTEYVSMRGGDGHYHDVAVKWDEYLPLEEENHFFITTADSAKGQAVLAQRNGLCIYS